MATWTADHEQEPTPLVVDPQKLGKELRDLVLYFDDLIRERRRLDPDAPEIVYMSFEDLPLPLVHQDFSFPFRSVGRSRDDVFWEDAADDRFSAFVRAWWYWFWEAIW